MDQPTAPVTVMHTIADQPPASIQPDAAVADLNKVAHMRLTTWTKIRDASDFLLNCH